MYRMQLKENGKMNSKELENCDHREKMGKRISRF